MSTTLGGPVELLFGFGFFQQLINRVAFLFSEADRLLYTILTVILD
jgi:hypothetical protein